MGDYLRGVDLSHWNNKSQYMTVKNYADFFILKATQGKSYVDPTYKERIKDICTSGKCFGSYHFYDNNATVDDQFNNIVKTMSGYPFISPYVIDCELKNMKWSKIYELANKLTSYYGRKPIIYTMWSMREFVEHSTYPVWIARYNTYSTRAEIIQGNTIMWQYGDKSLWDEQMLSVDGNYFKGTYKDFMNIGKEC